MLSRVTTQYSKLCSFASTHEFVKSMFHNFVAQPSPSIIFLKSIYSDQSVGRTNQVQPEQTPLASRSLSSQKPRTLNFKASRRQKDVLWSKTSPFILDKKSSQASDLKFSFFSGFKQLFDYCLKTSSYYNHWKFIQ